MRSLQRSRARAAALVMAALLPVAGGCAGLERKMQVEVVILNYNPQPVTNFVVAGQAIPGYEDSYRPGSAGGGSVCCVDVAVGKVEVEWEFDRPTGTPEPPNGFSRKAVGMLQKSSDACKFLGVHIYPGDIVEFTLTRGIPHEKEQGAAYE